MANSTQFEKISEVLFWLVEHRLQQPTLKEISSEFATSEFHLQKVFQDYAGVTPKQFLKHLSKEEALSRLRSGQTVLNASMDVGLSGPGRLHDLLITTEAVTPGQARTGGQNMLMEYGFGDSPFGDALVAWTKRGVSFLGFTQVLGRSQALEGLTKQWHQIQLSEQPGQAQAVLNSIFKKSDDTPVKVWLRGSPFQLKVWEALLKIPPSAHCSYGQIAAYLGTPSASRAVGTAIGRNPVSWLIPCHRVITSMGKLGGYRWGLETKQVILGLESGGIYDFPEKRLAI